MFGFLKKKKKMDEDAVALFVRLSADTASESDAAELVQWAETDPEKLDEVQLLSEIWHDAGEIEVDRSIFFEERTSSVASWVTGIKNFVSDWRVPVAATAMATMLVATVLTVQNTAPETGPVSYATLRGATERVELKDGSDLHLNGMSRVEVAYNETERRINMLEGEVYFEVAKDQSREFVVEAAGVEVKALGTAFDIDVGSNAVTIIVTEGVVSIGHEENIERFSAGNKIEVPLFGRGDGFRVTKLVLSDYEDAVTWRSGVLNFSGETLSAALEKINRQSKKPIVLIDPALSDLQIFGSFRKGNIASFISAIEALYPVRAVESHYRVALYNKDKRGNTKRAKDDHT